jgi:hypothetical protein
MSCSLGHWVAQVKIQSIFTPLRLSLIKKDALNAKGRLAQSTKLERIYIYIYISARLNVLKAK